MDENSLSRLNVALLRLEVIVEDLNNIDQYLRGVPAKRLEFVKHDIAESISHILAETSKLEGMIDFIITKNMESVATLSQY